MSLFKNRHKFEQTLKERIQDLEYRPSGQVWERIEAGLPEDGFEKAIRERLEHFERQPQEDNWVRIERDLPAARPRQNSRYYWLGLLVLLFGTGIYTGFRLSNHQTDAIALRADSPAGPMAAAAPQKEKASPTPLKPPGVNPKIQGQPALKQDGESPVKERKLNNAFTAESHPQDKENGTPKKPVILSGTSLLKSEQPISHISASTARHEKRQAATVKSPRPRHESKNRQFSKTTTGSSDQSLAGTLPVSGAGTAIGNSGELTAIERTMKDETGKSSSSNERSAATGVAKGQVINDPVPATPADPPATEPAKAPALSGFSNASLPVPDSILAAGRPVPTGSRQSAPDSTATKRAADASTADELSPLSITIFGGAHYCFDRLSAPAGHNFDQNIALRKKQESPDIGFAGGFLLNYHLGARIAVSAGVSFLTFYQRAYYNVTNAKSAHSGDESGAYLTNPTDSIIAGSGVQSDIKYSWTEIPLYVTYTIGRSGRFDFDLMAGVSYAMISGVSASIIARDNVGIFVLRDKDAFPGIRDNFFLNVNPVLSYKLSDGKVSVGLMPTFKYSLSSMIGNESWVQQNPYFIGASICLKRRF